MKQIIIFFLFIFIAEYAFCQSNKPVFHNKDYESFADFLADKLEEARIKFEIDTLCINSAIFAKFDIDSVGRISKISFSQRVSQVIKDVLESVPPPLRLNIEQQPPQLNDVIEYMIRASDGMWISPAKINGETIINHSFILPVFYTLLEKCENGTTRFDTFSFANMIHFDDEIYTELDCVLLRPVYITSKAD